MKLKGIRENRIKGRFKYKRALRSKGIPQRKAEVQPSFPINERLNR
jgi:hypothetical protein